MTTGNKALRKLAVWLRGQRESNGRPTYRELAERSGLHATTLQRAASGETVPSLKTVRAYARACGASMKEADALWKQARCEQRRSSREGGQPAPSPALVHDRRDLSAALRDLYERAGSPSFRQMEERAGNHRVLPRSTAHRIVTKQTVPWDRRQFLGFLRACEVPVADVPCWLDAWARARAYEEGRRVGPTSSRRDDRWAPTWWRLASETPMAKRMLLDEARRMSRRSTSGSAKQGVALGDGSTWPRWSRN
ncbi:helix-turn-helix transcriptional regulator [Streptomyces sp. ME02-8801-2C]|uniref:helix-turn-helix domain-containing protein n=1 Tax=Streptomyces sp. ME02-8801-2C TaxID=3028680 RepID=UPI0029B1FA8C|nr:helix-turn-helix transcriptional regulator [Streptomyces sp. ME02-8801-2C]MDX3458877.1 helix-turn-helix transcriptional regulator [Streptomyces sp. ME02-8801-2C]